MNKDLHEFQCSHCGGILLQFRRSSNGSLIYSNPPWGVVGSVIEPYEFIYDIACAYCGHVERVSPGFQLFGIQWKNAPIRISITPRWKGRLLPNVPVYRAEASAAKFSTSPLLRTCSAAFAVSVERIAAIAKVPIRTAGLSRQLRAIEERQQSACSESGNRGTPLKWRSQEGDAIRHSQTAKQHLFVHPLPRQFKMRIDGIGHNELHFWASAHKDINAGIVTTMSAQLVLAWTAFEVLASDLWVAAVNLQPNPLAVRFSQSLQDKAQGKSVTVSSLAAYGDHDFNLSNLMGEVLRDKADFASLQTTRAAYERTFGTDVPAFTSPNLRLLELVRNLILHKAGIVDSVFLKALRDKAIKVSHPDLSTLEGGQQLPITRSLAAALIDSAVDSGIAIMEFVLNHFWPPNDHKKPSNSSE